jgi:serine/threonine protein kinase
VTFRNRNPMTWGQTALPLSRYRVLACLGRGGMGEVYLALAKQGNGFEGLQALKCVRSDAPPEEAPELMQRFTREMRLAALLDHPNVVQTQEFGCVGGTPFIAMEYLDGQPLSSIQERCRTTCVPLPLALRLFVVCQVLDALAYAHSLLDYNTKPLGIVHRDVSPQNVFITYSGQVKLLDFGIAKAVGSATTAARAVKGRIAYMSPEQVRCERLDGRSDLFSVGVMLWELIAERKMHRQVSSALHHLTLGLSPSIRREVPWIPDSLERILARALAPNRSERYRDAGAFREELGAFMQYLPHVSGRDLGARVAELFAYERAERAALIAFRMTEPAAPPLALSSPRAPLSTAGPIKGEPWVGPTQVQNSKVIASNAGSRFLVEAARWTIAALLSVVPSLALPTGLHTACSAQTGERIEMSPLLPVAPSAPSTEQRDTASQGLQGDAQAMTPAEDAGRTRHRRLHRASLRSAPVEYRNSRAARPGQPRW